MANTLKQLIDYSKANPTSDVASKLQKAITAGAYDQQAADEGVDLTWAGRPKLTASSVVGEKPSFLEEVKQSYEKYYGKPITENIIKPLSNLLIKGGEALFPSYAEVGKMLGGEERTGKQIAGAAIQTATTPIAAALPGAISALGAAGQVGALSAASGFGKTLQEGGTFKEGAVNAFKSGLTGAIIGTGAYGVGKGIEKITEKAPEAIYNNVLKIKDKVIKAGKSPSKELLDEGLWGSLGTFQKASEEGIESANKVISGKIDLIDKNLTKQEVIDAAVNNLRKKFGAIYSDKELLEMINNVPMAGLSTGAQKEASYGVGNKIREQLDSIVKDNYLKPTLASDKIEAVKAVANSLRKIIQEGSNTVEDFDILEKWVNTSKGVSDAINTADKKFALGMKDIIAAGLGFTKAGPVGAAAAVTAERIAQSPATLTGLAQILKKIGEIPTDTAGKISKVVVSNLLGDFFKNIQKPQQ